MAKKKSSPTSRKAKASSESSPQESDQEPASLSFEARLADVESIVQALESGELSLDESLKQYERGVSQLRECHEHLSRVEGRVAVLSGFDEDGRPVTQPLESTSDSLEEKQGARSRHRGAGRISDDDAAVDDAPGLF